MNSAIKGHGLKPSFINILIINGLITILMLLGLPAKAPAQTRPSESPPLPYADVADLVTASPLVIKARIKSVKKVSTPPSAASAGVQNYLLVKAKVESLIRGDNGIPPEINFLAFEGSKADRPRQGKRVLLYARAGARPGEVQLVSRNALRPPTVELETVTRTITAELLRQDAPPAITAVGDAFHIAGTIAGEGETQIFLKTATGAPVSLSIVHRPGQPARWGVSLGEIVDETAVPPARDTLLWYRLACGLPPQLPPQATRTLPLPDAEAAQRDYRFVIESLGSCGRTL